ncbi:MAG TPA: peptidase C45, partial [Agriterribacter sp.]|nr:peptidase C45 [Agriterribacter sp.]
MRSVRKIGKWLLYSAGILMLLLLCVFVYVVYVSKTDPPVVADRSSMQWQRKDHGNGFYTLGNSWLRKSSSGLFELYVEGDPFERGVVNGKLSRELLVSQEDYFSAQISKMIPSTFYLHFLK